MLSVLKKFLLVLNVLKGLGHAILGNFSVDKKGHWINLNNKLTAQNYRRTQTKPKGKDGQHGGGLKWIAFA